MNRSIKIVILVVIAGIIGAFVYWQLNKKSIIDNSIRNTIAKKTDSLYYIKYDSSSIDEINGNASFYNVVLQSDDEQKRLLNSTDSLPNALYNIRIEKIAASGVDMAGLIKSENVAAKKILLVRPVVQIINTGADRPRKFTLDDTLQLYQKILGKFNRIEADTIQITNGTVLITNKAGKALTTLENINISLNKFLVDSTRNYESIVSYFIKDLKATVENIQLPASKNGTRINIEKLDYDAANKWLKVGSVKQYKTNELQPVIDLKNIYITDLNTDAFIVQQRLKAGTIQCDGGLITIYNNSKKGKKVKGDKAIDLSSDLIDQAQVSAINLGNTKIIILDKADPAARPFILTNTRFKVLAPVQLTEGSTVNNIVNNASWELAADGFTFDTKNNNYRISVGKFTVNNLTRTGTISNFLVKPLISEAEFAKKSAFSQDQYNLAFNNINLTGINIKNLLSDKDFEVETATFQPVIKVYNDKTLPPGTESKLGKYPHQSLVKLDIPIYIKKIRINNGSVSYREKAAKSGLVGNVFFEGIQATISNVTNKPGQLKANSVMTLDATARFLGDGKLSTQWKLPLTSPNGSFHINGQLQRMKAVTLNKITEPLAMASISQGTVDKVTFSMDGTDTRAVANVLFLYHDLKLDLLKKKGEDKELKKKGLVSLLANTIIVNENKNTANSKQVTNERDVTRSFFNLVWKTIYMGVKNTALGKKGNNPE